MGRIFAKLFQSEGCEVVISGPTERKGLAAADELGVKYIKDNPEAVRDADVVVVTVPMHVTVDVIKEVAPHVKKGALLMDLTSVKEEPCKAMAEHSNKDVEVVGTHPVFGPRVHSIGGQVFVLTPIRGKKWLSWLRDLLLKHKARIFESTPEEHDKTMAVVQGLTHFAYISIGKTLKNLDFDLNESKKYSSPVYELMLDMIGRIIGQDPNLYAEIQMENPRVLDVHDVFIKAAQTLSEVVRGKDRKAFVKTMVESAKHFGDVDQAMGRSDKAIKSQVSELEKLRNSVGRELCLQHIYSGMTHLGVVEGVTPEKVVLNDNGRKYELKLSNVSVLDNEERVEYKAEKYGSVQRDYSVLCSKSLDPKFVSNLLAEHNENLIEAAVGEIYEGPQIPDGQKSIVFKATLINSGVKETEKEVKEFFQKIGGTLR